MINMKHKTNGDVINIPNGAKGAYENLGYVEVKKGEKSPSDPPSEPPKTKDEKFIEHIKKVPISKWNDDQLKRYAKINKLDFTGVQNADDARERVKAHLDA